MTEKIGQTDTDKWAADMRTCRQITNEIISFGINQKQLLNIIKLLAMELENRSALIAISEVVKETLEETQVSNIITLE